MNHSDPFGEKSLQRLQQFLYFMPVFGIIPALWTLYRRNGTSQQQQASQTALRLALIWLILYSLISLGAGQVNDLLHFRLLYLEGLLTSGYFLLCLGLMGRVWLNHPPTLPGFSSNSRKSFKQK